MTSIVGSQRTNKDQHYVRKICGRKESFVSHMQGSLFRWYGRVERTREKLMENIYGGKDNDQKGRGKQQKCIDPVKELLREGAISRCDVRGMDVARVQRRSCVCEGGRLDGDASLP